MIVSKLATGGNQPARVLTAAPTDSQSSACFALSSTTRPPSIINVRQPRRVQILRAPGDLHPANFHFAPVAAAADKVKAAATPDPEIAGGAASSQQQQDKMYKSHSQMNSENNYNSKKEEKEHINISQ